MKSLFFNKIFIKIRIVGNAIGLYGEGETMNVIDLDLSHSLIWMDCILIMTFSPCLLCFRFYGGDVPRWNFTDFMHSFMIVFRVLCGEWIESMWDCMVVSGWPCVPFFLATVVIGNLVVSMILSVILLALHCDLKL